MSAAWEAADGSLSLPSHAQNSRLADFVQHHSGKLPPWRLVS